MLRCSWRNTSMIMAEPSRTQCGSLFQNGKRLCVHTVFPIMLRGSTSCEIPAALLLLLAQRTHPFQVPHNQWLRTGDCFCIEPDGSHHFRQLVCGMGPTPNQLIKFPR